MLFSSNTDTQMQNSSEPRPAHSMALDTCGSLVSPHRRATNAWGTRNNNQHKHTRENKRTRTHPHTSTWTRVGPWRGPDAAMTSMAPLWVSPLSRPPRRHDDTASRSQSHPLPVTPHTHTHTHTKTPKGGRRKKQRRQQSTIRCH